jgi:hypothetical protein
VWEVDPRTWRREMFGTGRMKREQAKDAALHYCRRHGWMPPDDNAAEAIMLVQWYRAGVREGKIRCR